MLGPALQQMFIDISNIPEHSRSRYEAEIYNELKILANVGELFRNRVHEVGLTAWWSNPATEYSIWLTSSPHPRFETGEPAEHSTYASRFRMSVACRWSIKCNRTH